jgi:dimethylglycine dehydrogenase
MLNPAGRLIGDFTLARAADDRFFLTGSGAAESYHMRWFLQHLPASGVELRCVSRDMLGLQIAGPRSRDLLQRLTRRDVSNTAFRFMAFGAFDVGMIPAWVGRVSYTGDLGYEIWVRPDYLRALFKLLSDAGADLAIRPFGGRALNSLRLEKGYGSWAREYRPIYTPFEAGLARFVDLKKPDFIGREAAAAARDAGPRRHLATFVVDALDADVIGDEPIWRADEVVGWVTSGGFAHASKVSVALGYVRADAFDPDATDYAIEIIGARRRARIQTEPLFDPTGARMRG